MATPTMTAVADGDNVVGNKRSKQFTVTGTTSYPTGGYTILPSDVGLTTITGVSFDAGNAASTKLTYGFVLSTGKLQFFLPTGGATAPATLTAPVAAAGAVSGAPGKGTLAVASGASTASAVDATTPSISGAPTAGTLAVSAAAMTAGIGLEVGNTTNVTTISLTMTFYGY